MLLSSRRACQSVGSSLSIAQFVVMSPAGQVTHVGLIHRWAWLCRSRRGLRSIRSRRPGPFQKALMKRRAGRLALRSVEMPAAGAAAATGPEIQGAGARHRAKRRWMQP